MANSVSLKWKNREAFFRQLISVVPEAEKALADANQVSAQAMVDMAQRLAPVKSGRLRDSIRMEPYGEHGGWKVSAGGPMTTHPVRKGAKATYDYALSTEWGRENQAAQPFFYPSYRSQKRPARARASRALTKAIKAKGFKTNG